MTQREKFIEILAKELMHPVGFIKGQKIFIPVDKILQAMQSAADAQTEQLRPYLRHSENCMGIISVDSNIAEHYDVTCTCGLTEHLK